MTEESFALKQMLTTQKGEHLCRMTFSRTKQVINDFIGWRTEAGGAVTSGTHCAVTHRLMKLGKQDSYTREIFSSTAV